MRQYLLLHSRQLYLSTTSRSSAFRPQPHQRGFSSSNNITNQIQNVVILGAGLMGSGIAQSCAATDIKQFNTITLQDISLSQLDRARRRIIQNLSAPPINPNWQNTPIDEILSRINFTTKKIDQLAEEEMNFTNESSNSNLLVIEAIPEVLQLKQSLFRSLNSTFNKDEDSETDKDNSDHLIFPIFATCSAHLAREQIAKHLSSKARFAGLHFNPEPTMKMVKIIRTNKTSPKTVKALERFVRRLGKVCIVSSDVPPPPM